MTEKISSLKKESLPVRQAGMKSDNLCQSLLRRQAGVIQTIYDIITKGHDGHIEVETEEGQGTEFTITLPKQ